MTKYVFLLLATISICSCNDNNNLSNSEIKQVDTVRLFVDSVTSGKAMAWDNFQLSKQSYDSINSTNQETRLFYFDAAIKMLPTGDALLAVELRKNVLKYLETRPHEFVTTISNYPSDTLIDIAAGIGIELYETEKQNASEKAKQLSHTLNKSFDMADTLKNSRVSKFIFYVDQPIKAMQNNNR